MNPKQDTSEILWASTVAEEIRNSPDIKAFRSCSFFTRIGVRVVQNVLTWNNARPDTWKGDPNAPR